ncbi:MAG TPA: hypothetical protein PLV92_25895, partial [Pirellulaceae bacterium]|nr:hypothetical protein [Pirellulaceae bacterium]
MRHFSPPKNHGRQREFNGRAAVSDSHFDLMRAARRSAREKHDVVIARQAGRSQGNVDLIRLAKLFRLSRVDQVEHGDPRGAVSLVDPPQYRRRQNPTGG